jgi:hypothetical protein
MPVKSKFLSTTLPTPLTRSRTCRRWPATRCRARPSWGLGEVLGERAGAAGAESLPLIAAWSNARAIAVGRSAWSWSRRRRVGHHDLLETGTSRATFLPVIVLTPTPTWEAGLTPPSAGLNVSSSSSASASSSSRVVADEALRLCRGEPLLGRDLEPEACASAPARASRRPRRARRALRLGLVAVLELLELRRGLGVGLGPRFSCSRAFCFQNSTVSVGLGSALLLAGLRCGGLRLCCFLGHAVSRFGISRPRCGGGSSRPGRRALRCSRSGRAPRSRRSRRCRRRRGRRASGRSRSRRRRGRAGSRGA